MVVFLRHDGIQQVQEMHRATSSIIRVCLLFYQRGKNTAMSSWGEDRTVGLRLREAWLVLFLAVWGS